MTESSTDGGRTMSGDDCSVSPASERRYLK